MVTLEVKDLDKRFGPLEVLRGVSLVAHEGDVIGIIIFLTYSGENFIRNVFNI